MLRYAPRASDRLVVSVGAVLVLLLAVPPVLADSPTTAQDFILPGTQPLSLIDGLATPDQCTDCHAGYGSPEVEPYRNWQGSMMAQSGRDPLMWAAMAVANQDLDESGETCLRCHLPRGWIEGRSVPTDGTAMNAGDRHGVQCSVCHRMVDPFGGQDAPVADAAIIAALMVPVTTLGSAQMVIDPEARLRGPFDVVADNAGDPHVPSHGTLVSPFHQSSALCGTCHNVGNPVFSRNAGGGYDPNPFGQPGNLALAFPEQSTYDEWKESEYASAGVYAPQFGGNKAVVSTCQDCHMPDVSGIDAEDGPLRDDLPLHSMVGANTFIPKVLPYHPVFGDEVDREVLLDGADKAEAMLRKAATLSADISAGQLTVRVSNESGHKLPTGYPDGRRMWLHVRATDAERRVVFESGRYVFETATLVGHDSANGEPDYDPYLQVWEAVHGMSPEWAAVVGHVPGPSSHLILNNVREKDNRIPPRGFANAAYQSFDGHPVGQDFADGQYWDDVVYPVGAQAVRAEVTLYYQTASREYIEFLFDENVTNAAGPFLYDLWSQYGMSEPVSMAQAFYESDAGAVDACRRVLLRGQGKYLKKYLKAWARCYQSSSAGVGCNEGALEAKVSKAAAKLRSKVGGSRDRRCATVDLVPETLGHGSVCPVPCDGTVVLYDMGDMADCAICVGDSLAGQALETAYNTSPPDRPAAAASEMRSCQKSLGIAVVKLATGWTGALLGCEDRNLGTASPADCSADPRGKIAKAKSKAARKVAACKSGFGGLGGCATAGAAADVSACMEQSLAAAVAATVEVAQP